VRKAAYIPDKGDLVWLNFTPQAGHEQAGHRPAIVLSAKAYNGKTGLMLCCPMTSKPKGYPFEVVCPFGGTQGVILADQLRNLDWRARSVKYEGKAGTEVVNQVRAKLEAILGPHED
jgi:mRNA interferase MazF